MTGHVSSRRRVLLTGASGFLGRHILAVLLERGWDVLALAHRSPLPQVPAGSAFDEIRVDPMDSDQLDRQVPSIDAICNAAAFIPSHLDDAGAAGRCVEVNALLPLRLAEFALRRRVRRFVHLSSAQAYQYSEQPVAEDHPLYPAERATYYLGSKLLGELFVEHLRRAHALNAVTLRVASCYGPGGPPTSVAAVFMDHASRGASIPVRDGGTPRYDLVYVSDVAAATVAALDSGDAGIYNVGSGQATSVAALASAIAATYPERNVQVSVSPPADSVHPGFALLNTEKARAAWNYRPLTLAEGLHRYRQALERDGECA